MTSFNDIIKSAPIVLIDFHADWCGPCKTLSPILKQLKDKRGDGLKLIKIDIDRNNQLAQNLNVQAVPTMLLYKEGRLTWRQSGVVPMNVIEQAIDR